MVRTCGIRTGMGGLFVITEAIAIGIGLLRIGAKRQLFGIPEAVGIAVPVDAVVGKPAATISRGS